MSEVKRYHVTDAGLVEGQALGRINVVLGPDYDSAVQCFLTAAEGCVAAERRKRALQALLTAADERVDVLEAALRTIMGSHRFNMPGMKVEEIHAICFDALTGKAALKPAEGGGKPCACPGCESTRRENSPFCAAHRSVKSRTRGQDPLTAERLEFMMQRDGYQQ
ncbi:hypothetical protein [Pseudomonas sp. WS 5079]|uniref:hypothetical protein n=1 Tax=Pseudomonas sp. WS 5079 TaxID=2717492 RepID=UPI0015559087|nr:hypothetical protein [Pseudomonas sp. WS 5079]NMX61505.1 hypothetical protein [Pseudomonas sp. WS 5079]